MRRRLRTLALLVLTAIGPIGAVGAGVDTLKDTADFDDCLIYSNSDCDPEETGEDCRRFNGGRVVNMGVGYYGSSAERRVLFKLPGWNDSVPDSSELKVYCYVQSSVLSRYLIAYPLTHETFEGTENRHNLGYYPDPDSGGTWLHAYLDVGDADSVLWSSPGGDYTTAVACSVQITGTGQYFTMRNFNRILDYWDTSGTNYGFILVNDNGEPAVNSQKVIKSSESGAGYYPLLLLYTAEEGTPKRRLRVVKKLLRE